MKYSVNRSAEENIADLMSDAGLSTFDQVVVMDSMEDLNSEEVEELEEQVRDSQGEIYLLKSNIEGSRCELDHLIKNRAKIKKKDLIERLKEILDGLPV